MWMVMGFWGLVKGRWGTLRTSRIARHNQAQSAHMRTCAKARP
jgi:hypothetical protein